MLDLIAPLLLFVLAMSITPGPNVLMVAASAANFGVRPTVPHMLGVTIGFPAMVFAVGAGLSGVFHAYPQIHVALKYVGAAYLLFLAWKIANAGRAQAGGAKASPISLIQAALFQWVNPKAWIAAVGAIATYTTLGGNLLVESTIIALLFAAVSLPCLFIWAAMGAGIGRFLESSRARLAFNLSMAALLVASLVPVLW
jgi:threonine/homoserine/homoserine lactone efflux protein